MKPPWDRTPTSYAGIGSRTTPPSVLAIMRQIAGKLARLGWTLRSGGADGADAAFETGAFDDYGQIELFVPWSGFNGKTLVATLPTGAAFDLAAKHHPAWSSLRYGVRALHARNCHQVLGADLVSPSAFVLCWTPDGAVVKTTGRTGGTGQAIRIANAFGVPVYNLARQEHLDLWSALVQN